MFVVLKVGDKCPYLDEEDYHTCEDAEWYCDSNIAARTHCGGLFGAEGFQVDADKPVLVVEGDDEYDDDDMSPTYDTFVRTFTETTL